MQKSRLKRLGVRTASMLFFAVILALVASPSAFAHHFMGGGVPTGIAEGVLSGLAHPVIGIDHFAFVVLVGLVAVVSGLGLWLGSVFVLAGLAGVGLHVAGVKLPLAELLIALSVVLVGAGVSLGRRPGIRIAVPAFAAAGLLHGWAFGASIVGAEPAPLAAYLVGLGIVQCAVILVVGNALGHLCKVISPRTEAVRILGALMTGIGVAFLVEAVEAGLFPI